MAGKERRLGREEGLSRRQFVGATGAAALPLMTGVSTAEMDEPVTENATALDDSQAASLGGIASLGGRLIVGAGGYETIEAAWEAASDGDSIYVHSSYDAQSANEDFPIILDYTEKEVVLTGGHPSGSVIDAGDSDQTVIRIEGPGHHDYRVNPLVQNLRIVGGRKGIVVTGAPYASFKDVLVWKASQHAFSIESREDDDGNDLGTFGVTFRNCIAWNNGGVGFRLDSDAVTHATTFFGCDSLFNGGDGFQLRGYSSRIYGGVVQNNGGEGIDVRSGCGQMIHGVYFEGNGTKQSTPIDLYAGPSATGLTVESCYFQGNFARDFDNGRDHGELAIAVDSACCSSIQNCTYRNYDGAFLRLIDTVDTEVARSSHYGLDDTTFVDASDVTRLRSDGTIQETNLLEVTGGYSGDVGIHDGEGDNPWGFALWNGESWVSVMDGQPLV